MTTQTASASVADTAKKPTRRLNIAQVNGREQRFGSFIDSTIIGQANGRRAARRAFRRTVSKLRMPNQPYYVIVAPGPTTSGKSELAYRLGEYFHGNRARVVKIDGSEYMDKHNLSHLTGASPNLVGYTNRKDKDYVAPLPHEKDAYAELSQHNLNRSKLGSKSDVVVVLIDEWEKACIEFNTIMLSIFREGRYTLGNGEEVDFTNCIFVLTANIGSAAVEDAQNRKSIGFFDKSGITSEEADKIVNDHLRAFAPPEFRARVEENGEICIFQKLTKEQIASLCKLKVTELCSRIQKDAKIIVDIDVSARDWLLAKSGSVALMNGAVKTDIIDVLDNELLKGEIGEESVIHVSHNEGDDGLSFEVDVREIVVGVGDDEFAAITAEEDRRRAALRGKLGAADVDETRVREAVAEASGAQAVTSGGVTSESASVADAVVKQPFQVQFQCSTREVLASVRGTLFEAIAGASNTIPVRGEMTYVEPFIGTFDVYSTLEAMVALKKRFPAVSFTIMGGELG